MNKKLVQSFFNDVESGKIKIEKLNAGNNSNINYKASNGWEFTIFNDSGSFDYIDYLKTNDGTEYFYDELESIRAGKNDRVYGILQYYEKDKQFKVQSELYTDNNDDEEELYEDNNNDISKSIVISNLYDELKIYLSKHPEKLYDLTPRKFEELIADILKDFGFDCQLTQATRDGGFDIYAQIKNSITSFLIYVECKKYNPSNKVGAEIVRSLYGVAKADGVHKSMIVTTSFFTKPAMEYHNLIKNEMDLKDFVNLKEWLAKYTK